MKILQILVLALTITSAKSQSPSIQLPSSSYFEIREDFKNLLTIKVDQNGDYYVNDTIAKDVNLSLYRKYKHQILNARLDFSFVTIEIVADNRVPFQRIINLLNLLTKANFYRVFFTVQTNDFNRIEKIWSVGVQHLLNTTLLRQINNNFAVALRDELKMLPPPPPPPPLPGEKFFDPYTTESKFSYKHYLNNQREYKNIDIAMGSGGWIIENKMVSNIEFLEYIKSQLSGGKCYIILSVESELNYGAYIKNFITLKQAYTELRNTKSNEMFKVDYYRTSLDQQQQINDMYPYLVEITQK